MGMDRVIRDVDRDQISFFDQTDLSARCSFRSHMTDGRAPAGTRKTSICDQRYGLIQFHSCQRAGRIEHFAHARAAFWPFIADHDDVAVMDPAAVDRFDRFFFRIKYAGRAGVDHHAFIDRTAFYDTAVRSDISEQDRDPACVRIRGFYRTDRIFIFIKSVFYILADRFPVDCHQGSIDQAEFI